MRSTPARAGARAASVHRERSLGDRAFSSLRTLVREQRDTPCRARGVYCLFSSFDAPLLWVVFIHLLWVFHRTARGGCCAPALRFEDSAAGLCPGSGVERAE